MLIQLSVFSLLLTLFAFKQQRRKWRDADITQCL